MLKVNVNWPKDMDKLESLAAETLAKILIKKLPESGIEYLIKVLENDDIHISM